MLADGGLLHSFSVSNAGCMPNAALICSVSPHKEIGVRLNALWCSQSFFKLFCSPNPFLLLFLIKPEVLQINAMYFYLFFTGQQNAGCHW